VNVALAKDADLLSDEERAQIDAKLAALRKVREGRDHRAIKDAIVALNEASEPFAGRRMDRAVSAALSGQRVDEVRTR
jgi:molecular chaperone HscA